MLAEYILHGEEGEGRSAIELGCGLGLVLMAAAKGGWRVIATDCDPISLRFAEYNASLNRADIAAFELLDWHHPPAGRRFERVFAADVLYQLVDHAPIAQCVDQLLAGDGVALLADPNRGVADRFVSTAEDYALDVNVIPAAATNLTGRNVDGRIFLVRHRGAE